jgi:hypothetical protein
MVAITSPWVCQFASRILIGAPLTPMRFVLAVTTTLIHEGFKVKVNTWIGTQKRRGRTKVLSGVKLTFNKTIRWVKWGRRRKNDPEGEVQDVVTMDAGMKYKELAERRLSAARTAFEAAAVELRAAERGVRDAEKYFESLRSHCDKAKKLHEFNDVVLVDHAS